MAELTAPDIARLQALEESLWRAETRYDLAYMESVLAPDCFEFGRSGRTYTRAQLLDMPSQPQSINAKLPLAEFAARMIDVNTALVTYISSVMHDGILDVGNRSSLWSRTATGWQLRFHQGTAVHHSTGIPEI